MNVKEQVLWFYQQFVVVVMIVLLLGVFYLGYQFYLIIDLQQQQITKITKEAQKQITPKNNNPSGHDKNGIQKHERVLKF